MTYFTHKEGRFLGPPGARGLYDGTTRVEREGYAIEIVRRPDPRPFFPSLHFNAPHWPWEGPQVDRARNLDPVRPP